MRDEIHVGHGHQPEGRMLGEALCPTGLAGRTDARVPDDLRGVGGVEARGGEQRAGSRRSRNALEKSPA